MPRQKNYFLIQWGLKEKEISKDSINIKTFKQRPI
jgi:hypothetical protein